MRNNFLKFIAILFLVNNSLFGQDILQAPDQVSKYKIIPQEKVFIHFNSTLLFAGEYLYYKVYCLNANNNTLSSFSKIAYVELVSENKKVIFTHKVSLEKGSSYGDFFIPVSVPSGNYKLIGYTRWMRNSVEQNFSQSDISIINPYQSDQETILSSNDVLEEENLSFNNSEVNTDKSKIGEEILMIDTKVELFGKREKVELSIKTLGNSSINGNYSISVRRKDNFRSKSVKLGARNFIQKTKKRVSSQVKNRGDSFYLPELRGELISGSVISKETGKAISNQKVAVSIPGKESYFKVVQTNQNGVFYFSFEKEYNAVNGVFQILGNEKEQYKLVLDKHNPVGTSNMQFYKFRIAPTLKEEILSRSIHNQIENSYFNVKPDTIIVVNESNTINLENAETYNLDEYTRFPTIKETLTEVVKNAWFKKINEEKEIFQVRGYDAYSDPEFLPLVIIDGIFIQNHQDLFEYNPKKLKRISVLRGKHFYGSQIFEGVLLFETLKGDYNLITSEDYINQSMLFKPIPKKKYFEQQYNTTPNDTLNRIPDFRHQILWTPNVPINKQNKIITFFTSDVEGEYEISLEGFTDTGHGISIIKTIIVN